MNSGRDIKNGVKAIYLIISLLLIFVIIFNLYIFTCRTIDKNNLENEINEINEMISESEVKDNDSDKPMKPTTDYWNYLKISPESVNLENLRDINKDTVGFLSISGTNINYPIVQSGDNKFYLNHSFKKEYNSCGWIFMDHRNNPSNFDKNTVIYGHSNLDKTMFGSLSDFMHSDWLNNSDNGKITLINESGITHWRAVSVYTIPAESYYIRTKFNSQDDFKSWLDVILRRSIYNFNYKYSNEDKIMTFSTCYKNEGDIRLVVHAKEV